VIVLAVRSFVFYISMVGGRCLVGMILTYFLVKVVQHVLTLPGNAFFLCS
jgi:hypothetical protein